jgi:hypothetical protein
MDRRHNDAALAAAVLFLENAVLRLKFKCTRPQASLNVRYVSTLISIEHLDRDASLDRRGKNPIGSNSLPSQFKRALLSC